MTYAIPGASHQMVELDDGVTLSVHQIDAEGEAGDRPAVVFSHGFPDLAFAWRSQLAAVAGAGFDAIAPDQRGYGGSSRPDAITDYDIHHLTGDLVGILDRLDIERAVFVGHDWGGFVVWQMPLLHPDRVAGVVGVNTPYIPRLPIPPTEAFRMVGVGLRGRLISAALAGGTVLFGMVVLFPKFFKGPLVDADPYIMTDFMPYVTEAMPLFKAPWDDILQEVAQPLLAAVLLVFCLRHRLRPEKRRMLMLWGALLACTAVLTVIEARWEYYLQPVAIIVCAALLPELSMLAPRLFPPRLRSRLGIPRQWRPDLAVFLLAMIVNFAVNLPRAVPLLTGGGGQAVEKSAVSAAKESTAPESCTGEIRYVLQTGQLPALLGKDNLVLFVTPDAGGDVLFFTQYRIIASNYHREGPGLHDMMRIATAKSPEAARPLLRARQVGAMLYCNAEEKKALWPYTVAKTGKHPRWLVPVPGLHFSSAKGDKPLLFKVEE